MVDLVEILAQQVVEYLFLIKSETQLKKDTNI
jgi:hypothetical protein